MFANYYANEDNVLVCGLKNTHNFGPFTPWTLTPRACMKTKPLILDHLPQFPLHLELTNDFSEDTCFNVTDISLAPIVFP